MKALEPLCGAFVNLNFQTCWTKEVEGLPPPSAPLTRWVRTHERHAQSQVHPGRWGGKSCMLSGPCIKTTRRTNASTRMATRRDQTTGVPARPSAFPQPGQGAWGRSPPPGEGWTSPLLVSSVAPVLAVGCGGQGLTHHCCVAKVQKRDAAYHMPCDEENAAAVACGSSNLWVCLLLVSLNGTHIEPVLDWRERVEACWTLPSRGTWWVKIYFVFWHCAVLCLP